MRTILLLDYVNEHTKTNRRKVRKISYFTLNSQAKKKITNIFRLKNKYRETVKEKAKKAKIL
jgi:hypothetical protein